MNNFTASFDIVSLLLEEEEFFTLRNYFLNTFLRGDKISYNFLFLQK